MFPKVKTGKYSNRLSTGNKGGVEVVQAMKYDTLKAELDAGKIEPTKQAIAQRIFDDRSGNLIYPKCEKVAESILKRYTEESQNTRPSSPPSENDKKLTRKPSPNLTRKVGKVDSGKVKVDNLEQYLSGGNTADILYKVISEKVKSRQLKPTFPPMKKAVHSFLKEQQLKHKESVLDIPPMPRIQAEVESIFNRMLIEGAIAPNPNSGNGRPKYLVV